MTERLYCGRAAWDRLKELSAPAPPGDPPPLFGMPIYIDPELRPGQWEIRDDGAVVMSGDLTPTDPSAFYAPGLGFFAATTEGTTP